MKQLLLILLGLCPAFTFAEDTSSLQVTVVASGGEPIAGANVDAFRWSGVWDDLQLGSVSDAQGQASVTGLPLDRYLGLRVAAPGYAKTMSHVEFSQAESRDLTIKLSPPTNPVIKLIDGNGDPIEGAEIMRLEFVDANATEVFVTQRTAQTHMYDWPASDKQGRLTLPPVPQCARLEFSIVHPDYKSVQVADAIASDGEVASATMEPGVRIRFRLIPEGDAPESLDGLKVRVVLSSLAKSATGPTSIDQSFPVKDNQIEVTARSTACPMSGHRWIRLLTNLPVSVAAGPPVATQSQIKMARTRSNLPRVTCAWKEFSQAISLIPTPLKQPSIPTR